jgi:hypothetical protein
MVEGGGGDDVGDGVGEDGVDETGNGGLET